MSTGWLKIRNSSTVCQFWELMGDFKNMINPLSSFLRAANLPQALFSGRLTTGSFLRAANLTQALFAVPL